jgi:hypothetical protein
MGESQKQMAGPTNLVEAPEEAAPESRGGMKARDRGRVPRREGAEVTSPVGTVQDTTGDEIRGGKVRREMTGGDRTAVWAGVRDDDEEGCRHVVALTPEGSWGEAGGKLEIHLLVVDMLEEYCGFPQGTMWKWQMQLGIEDNEILPLLQVAQPGDRHWGEMTLERVRLSSCGVSGSSLYARGNR